MAMNNESPSLWAVHQFLQNCALINTHLEQAAAYHCCSFAAPAPDILSPPQPQRRLSLFRASPQMAVATTTPPQATAEHRVVQRNSATKESRRKHDIFSALDENQARA